VIAADAQTVGRAWAGAGTAGGREPVSPLLRPTCPAAEIPPLTLLAGAAIASASRRWACRRSLRPNDAATTRRERRSLAALTEMVSAGERIEHVVVGGINVTDHVSRRVRRSRASLRIAPGQPVDRAGARNEPGAHDDSSGAGRRRRSRPSPRIPRFPSAAASTTACRASRWASIPTARCACATTRGGFTV
jgi:hypothetical protein